MTIAVPVPQLLVVLQNPIFLDEIWQCEKKKRKKKKKEDDGMH